MKSSGLLKQKVSENVEIPKDILSEIPLLTITGEIELSLENHSGIIEYTDSIIRIRTRKGQLKINGKNLKTIFYTNDEIKINGRFDSIEFCR